MQPKAQSDKTQGFVAPKATSRLQVGLRPPQTLAKATRAEAGQLGTSH